MMIDLLAIENRNNVNIFLIPSLVQKYDMYNPKVKLKVRYAETDQMGYCYYGNYAQYF